MSQPIIKGVSVVESQDPISLSISSTTEAEADIAFGTIPSNQRVVITGVYVHSTANVAGALTIRTKASGDGGVGIPIPLVVTLDSKQLPGMRLQCAWGDLPTRQYSGDFASGSITVVFTWDLETRLS